jgi:hypothetical protein
MCNSPMPVQFIRFSSYVYWDMFKSDKCVLSQKNEADYPHVDKALYFAQTILCIIHITLLNKSQFVMLRPCMVERIWYWSKAQGKYLLPFSSQLNVNICTHMVLHGSQNCLSFCGKSINWRTYLDPGKLRKWNINCKMNFIIFTVH